jgi:DNA-binding transcriptional ArsR family regulator
MKFFLNPGNQEYLRGLAQDFDVSTNTVRQELNKLSDTGVLTSHEVLNKRYYQVNEQHALFEPIRRVLLRHTGLDSLYEMVISRLGALSTVYLTGALASGVDSPIIDLIMVGNIDRDYLNQLVPKAENFIGKKIRIAVYAPDEWDDVYIDGQQVMKLL